MQPIPLHLLLADDDPDDRLLFKEVLEELDLNVTLTTANDGEQLMKLLSQKNHELPGVIFLDLNMPRKNGFECIAEIKMHSSLQHIPVIIYSTSFDPGMVHLLQNSGASHYIQKPSEFRELKKVIQKAIGLIRQPELKAPFIIKS